MKNLLYIGNKLSVHGYNLTTIETLGPLLESEGYHVWYASSNENKMLRQIHMVCMILRYSAKIDYVIIDTYGSLNFWYTGITSQLCRLLNLKYIPILHGGTLPARLENDPKWCEIIFGNAYINVAPSQHHFQIFEKAGFKNIVRIPNVIELQQYPFKHRDHISPNLLWVRSLASIYNPEMAVRVLYELQKEFNDATLCMVGPDKDGLLPQLKNLCQELNVDVHFTGKLPKTEWIAIAQNYDIFINTTHVDNMPVSVIEAMALGLPIVSTNVGGITYLLDDGKTAMLVADDDVKGMTAAISRILKEASLSSQLIENARIKSNEFDWVNIKHRWAEILK